MYRVFNSMLTMSFVFWVYRVNFTSKTCVCQEAVVITRVIASAERLLSLRRGHWSIENKLHWMRDTLLGEDTSPVRCGAIPQVMAALRNTVLSDNHVTLGYNST